MDRNRRSFVLGAMALTLALPAHARAAGVVAELTASTTTLRVGEEVELSLEVRREGSGAVPDPELPSGLADGFEVVSQYSSGSGFEIRIGGGRNSRTMHSSMSITAIALKPGTYKLSFDVDDMTGEEIGVAADRLRAAEGVLDLSLGQRFGKKSRPLTEFRLLVEPARLDAIAELCLTETSTIGVRRHEAVRRVLARSADAVAGGDGRLRRKLVERPDGRITAKVESDDVAGIGGLDARRRAGREAEERR